MITMDSGAIQEFSMGVWTLAPACVAAFVGSLIGLCCVARARAERRRPAAKLWTAGGAVAIGGVGVWLMHLIAMLGFAVAGSQVRYSAPLTALSGLIAVAAVGSGLSFVTLRRFTVTRLLYAGVATGIGIAFAHYLGMAAIRFQGDIAYDPVLVALSLVIAVVAATATLWFTVVVRTTLTRLAACLVTSVAVTGMHYTGMAAVRVTVIPSRPPPTDADAFGLMLPVFVSGGLVIAVLLWSLFTSVEPGAHATRG